MSKKTRRRRGAGLKANVALETLCNKATVAELAAKYQLRYSRIRSAQPHSKIAACRTCPKLGDQISDRLRCVGNLAQVPHLTSPALPPSATAMAFLSFAVSKAMKASLSPSIGSSSVLR
jgi:hypothetical protein